MLSQIARRKCNKLYKNNTWSFHTLRRFDSFKSNGFTNEIRYEKALTHTRNFSTSPELMFNVKEWTDQFLDAVKDVPRQTGNIKYLYR